MILNSCKKEKYGSHCLIGGPSDSNVFIGSQIINGVESTLEMSFPYLSNGGTRTVGPLIVGTATIKSSNVLAEGGYYNIDSLECRFYLTPDTVSAYVYKGVSDGSTVSGSVAYLTIPDSIIGSFEADRQ